MQCNPHILSRFPIGEVFVNEKMRILVIGEIIINKCGFSDLFRGGNPSGKTRRHTPVMNPVDHISTLPGMVTTKPWLQPTWGIKLVFVLGSFKRYIKAWKLDIFRLKSFGFLTLLGLGDSITTKNPVILGSFCKEDWCVLKIGWANARDFFPVLPKGGLVYGKRLK